MLKRLLAFGLLALFAISAFGAVTVAEKGETNLNISGSMFPGFSFDMEAEDKEPAASFSLGTVWLILYGDLTEDFGYYFLYAVSDGNTAFPIGNISYTGVENLAIRAGRFKVPFGRMYNTSGLQLMFKSRNPMNTYYGNGDDMGVAAKYSLLDGRLDVEGGVFNGGGTFSSNDDSQLKYSGYIAFAPWGQIPMHESAHMGYDEMKLVIMPGITIDGEDFAESDDPLKITKYGAHVAFRMKTLAADVLYYMSSTDHESFTDPSNTSGFSVQAGYTIGKIEPCVRFSMYDPNTDEDDAPETLSLNSRTTIEAGINYYIKGYQSRLGLNYTNSSVAEDDDDTRKTSRIDLYYELFF